VSGAAALLGSLGTALLLSAAAPDDSAGPAGQLALQAGAATADSGHGRILYLKHCAECHGARAWGDGLREIPALAGQRQKYLLLQLARFASGERPGSVTHGPAMHDALAPPDVDRPQALADLAAYLAQAAPDPHPEQSEGRTLEAGRLAYLEACAACHGSDGGGSERAAIPAIAGQHYSYLLAQLQSFAAGRRSHALFADAGAALSLQQQQALADYLARLGVRAAADEAH